MILLNLQIVRTGIIINNNKVEFILYNQYNKII